MKWPHLAAALVLLLLSGCWSRIEVNDLAIVGIIAMDREENGDLRISLQIVTPQRIAQPGGQSGQAGARRPFLVVSDTGPTGLEAIRKMQLQLPRRIFLAHANVVLVGERLARSGLLPVEDFLSRFREIRPTSRLLVTEGEAVDMLSIQPELEREPAENIGEILRTRVGISTTLREYIRDRRQSGLDPVLPWLGVAPPAPGREAGNANRNFVLRGSGVFVGDRLVTLLKPRDTRALMVLRGQGTVGIMTTPMPEKLGSGQMFSTEVHRASADRNVRWQQGQPAVAVKVKLDSVLESIPPPVELRSPTTLFLLQRALEQDTALRLRDTLERVRALGADPFGFGLLIRNSSPAAWRLLAPRWREALPKLPVSIDVQCHLGSTERTNRSQTTQEGDDPP